MKSLAELAKIREAAQQNISSRTDGEAATRIVVGMATCGIAAGARPVLAALMDEAEKRNLNHVSIAQTGCIGMCRLEPLVEVTVPGQEKVTYVKMTPEKAVRVINEHIVNGKVVTEYTIGAAE